MTRRVSVRRPRATVLAITSDHHCGSSVALCPPLITLDDGGTYEASKAQRWLWQGWQSFWKRVEAVRKEEQAALYQIFNGDFTEGFHHGSTQNIGMNPNVQAFAVNAAMAVPLALSPDQIFGVRGTESHVGQSACAEERIFDGLRRNKNPVVPELATGNASHWHLKLEIDGVRFDFAHHGRVGTRPWTKPNVTMNLAAEIFYNHALNEEPHPHLAVRSHMHQYVDTGVTHPVRVIQTPAWQLATSFIHRIAPGAIADVGGVIVVIKNGRFTVEPVMFRPNSAPTWRPST